MDSDSMTGSETDEEHLQELLAHPGLYAEEERQLCINNKEGLEEALKELKKDLPWVERLDLTCAPVTENEVETVITDVHDDFKREALFYRQAQATVIQGLKLLKQFNIRTKRPTDYYVEMLKDDKHMLKVRENLLTKSKQLELRQKARQLREMRKMGKKIQQESTAQKQKQKTEFLKSVKKYQKAPGKGNLEEILGGGDSKTKPSSNQNKSYKKDATPSKRGMNQKRMYKNKHFGFGGQKKRSKGNTKDSHMNISDFSVVKHGATPKNAAKINQRAKKQSKKGRKSR